jgi:hypothetical protein
LKSILKDSGAITYSMHAVSGLFSSEQWFPATGSTWAEKGSLLFAIEDKAEGGCTTDVNCCRRFIILVAAGGSP